MSWLHCRDVADDMTDKAELPAVDNTARQRDH